MTATDHHEYLPGGWTAVVGDGLAALVEPGAARATVDGLWEVVRDGGGVLAALGVLAAGGFADLPSFAVVDVAPGGDVHAVLRGDVVLTVTGDDGAHEVTAQSDAVWTEHRATTAAGCAVAVADAPGDAWWPLRGGVVHAVALRVAERAPQAAATAEPAGPASAGPDAPGPDDTEPPTQSGPLRARGGARADRTRSEARIAAATLGALAETADPAGAEPVEAGAAPVEDAAASTSWWEAAEPEPEPEPEPVAVPRLLPPGDDDAFVLTPADVPTPAVSDLPMIGLGVHDVDEDDHDGLTILSSDLAQIRDQLPTWNQDAVPGPFLAPVQAPLQARIVLSTGLVVPLDRSVLLGRAPQVARVTNRELPRLVTVPSPNQDISRTHAEVRVDGEHVVVTDLDSTNGVHVSRAGEGVRRLHPGEPSVVAPDEVVDLGDGVTFTVERTA